MQVGTSDILAQSSKTVKMEQSNEKRNLRPVSSRQEDSKTRSLIKVRQSCRIQSAPYFGSKDKSGNYIVNGYSRVAATSQGIHITTN